MATKQIIVQSYDGKEQIVTRIHGSTLHEWTGCGIDNSPFPGISAEDVRRRIQELTEQQDIRADSDG